MPRGSRVRADFVTSDELEPVAPGVVDVEAGGTGDLGGIRPRDTTPPRLQPPRDLAQRRRSRRRATPGVPSSPVRSPPRRRRAARARRRGTRRRHARREAAASGAPRARRAHRRSAVPRPRIPAAQRPGHGRARRSSLIGALEEVLGASRDPGPEKRTRFSRWVPCRPSATPSPGPELPSCECWFTLRARGHA